MRRQHFFIVAQIKFEEGIFHFASLAEGAPVSVDELRFTPDSEKILKNFRFFPKKKNFIKVVFGLKLTIEL